MANVTHSSLTGSKLHEPKGVASAAVGKVYISDGAGSGDWTYLPIGWGNYKDDGAAQTFTTSAAKLQNDGAGTDTDITKLPREIRGSSSLWDTTNDKITPITAGDSYTLRIDLPITAKTGSPTELEFTLDVGGAAGITDILVTRFISVSKTPPYNISVGFPVPCGTDFKNNGGQVFLSTDTGTIEITKPQVFISMLSSGNI
jgi:hypothetical protein